MDRGLRDRGEDEVRAGIMREAKIKRKMRKKKPSVSESRKEGRQDQVHRDVSSCRVRPDESG